MIAIIDYGMGNLKSVQKALKLIGMDSFITSDKEKLKQAGGIILPGVGAFPFAAENLRKSGMDNAIKEFVKTGKPMLGICLGMQLLFDESEEVRKCKGLGLIKGRIVKIKTDKKIPHMGWNSLNIKKEGSLLKNIKEGSYVYFVHSYCADTDDEFIDATTDYGIEIPAAVSFKNVYGLQFHPEKSGDVGINILRNFKELVK